MSEDGYARVAGRNIWVSMQGEGPPLLLLMGIGGSTVMWRPLRSLLTGFRTIAFDMPGTGRTPADLGLGMGMSRLAGLAAGVLEAVGVAKADVLGYSFGGAVARELAHRYPNVVRRLILVATTFGTGAVPGSPLALACMLTPLRYYSSTFLRLITPFTFGGETPPTTEHQRDRMSAPPTLMGYFGQLAAMSTWTSRPWLSTLPHQTLVVMGGDDRLVPVANGRYLARRIPRAQLVVVPKAGHLLLLDGHRGAYEAIREFLLSPAPPAQSAASSGAA